MAVDIVGRFRRIIKQRAQFNAGLSRKHPRVHRSELMLASLEIKRLRRENEKWRALCDDGTAIRKANAADYDTNMRRVDDALEQIEAVCLDNAPETCRHDMALKFIFEIAKSNRWHRHD